MKIITIGRDDDADIRLNNPEISRRHANIRYGMFGKMEIRDLSLNGTSINGRRLPANKFVPVSRKDVVSFADVAKLDWKEVPDPMKPYRIGAIIIAAIIILLVAFSLLRNIDFGKDKTDATDAPYDYEETVDGQANPGKADKGTIDLDTLGTTRLVEPDVPAPAERKKSKKASEQKADMNNGKQNNKNTDAEEVKKPQDEEPFVGGPR